MWISDQCLISRSFLHLIFIRYPIRYLIRYPIRYPIRYLIKPIRYPVNSQLEAREFHAQCNDRNCRHFKSRLYQICLKLSTHRGYKDQEIRIMDILHKSSIALCIFKTKQLKNFVARVSNICNARFFLCSPLKAYCSKQDLVVCRVSTGIPGYGLRIRKWSGNFFPFPLWKRFRYSGTIFPP